MCRDENGTAVGPVLVKNGEGVKEKCTGVREVQDGRQGTPGKTKNKRAF